MSITDTLLLGPEELVELCKRYSTCQVEKLTTSKNLFQQYRVHIEGEDEEGYYNFLLDKGLAMSSDSFYTKMKSDKTFARRIKRRT
ncbi:MULTISPECIES: hypothetical protein [Citrifermentans]|uniref:Uncharacterized protein n=1 Tax=Citrifermentans bemidjiense (strain ATCC BAA-1014 / DSM 16622 / JCM 12645 / Bem) TaxID=404380 RepID=E1P693_CITBB|nr:MULTISPECIES: hypothetical protein [Citrifermentans]ADO00788.1 hypothetical protein Gbem_4087 [Citrifermentans bemidjiense Bem]